MSQKFQQGIYKIIFSEALKRAEYCFMFAGSNASTYGSHQAEYKVFDFGVRIVPPLY
jgi:hypothetical protein